MAYEFSDLDDLEIPQLTQQLRAELLGTVVVGVSFDSHRLVLPSWRRVNGYCVSAPVNDAFIDCWPVSHEGYCDEWWAFDVDVPEDFEVNAFCNFIGTRIGDYKKLNFEGGYRLDLYLERFGPRLVFGNNEWAYLVRRVALPYFPPEK